MEDCTVDIDPAATVIFLETVDVVDGNGP